MKKLLYVLVIIASIFPILINASTSLSATPERVIVGQDVRINLNINYGDKKISKASYIIEYDENLVSFKSIIWAHSEGTYQNENGTILIEKNENTAPWEYGTPVTIIFEVKKKGTLPFTITEKEKAFFTTGEAIKQSTIGVKVSAEDPNDNTKLKELYIKGYNISPVFSKSIYSYSLVVAQDVLEVEIVATKSDESQTITGTGIKYLNYGDNRVYVDVTAENGTTQRYQIMIHRTDNRTGDITLKSLTVSNTNIFYQKDIFTYNAEVGKNIDSILIKATPNDPLATVSGDIGEKKLNLGKNTFKISVKTNADQEQIYTINVTKLDKIIEPEKPSSKLASLAVNGKGINLNNNNKIYLIGVEKNVEKLDIIEITESSSAKVEITGNESLKVGTNKVMIKVTETNGEYMEYTLIVYKNPASATVIDDLNDISNCDTDILYNTKNSETKIKTSLLKQVFKDNNKLYYNVVNNNNGILYRLILNQKVNLEKLNEIDLSFTETEKDSLNYETSLPANINVELYLNNLYLDDTILRIYTYDEKTGYKLLTAGTKVENGYINFKTDGSKYYLITQRVLLPEDDVITTFLKKYKLFFIVAILGTIILLVLYFIINKKQKELEAKEPQY